MFCGVAVGRLLYLDAWANCKAISIGNPEVACWVNPYCVVGPNGLWGYDGYQVPFGYVMVNQRLGDRLIKVGAQVMVRAFGVGFGNKGHLSPPPGDTR